MNAMINAAERDPRIDEIQGAPIKDAHFLIRHHRDLVAVAARRIREHEFPAHGDYRTRGGHTAYQYLKKNAALNEIESRCLAIIAGWQRLGMDSAAAKWKQCLDGWKRTHDEITACTPRKLPNGIANRMKQFRRTAGKIQELMWKIEREFLSFEPR